MGLETTLKRPIVNTRDEPHADPKKYRRLHVIIGDANLSEIATYLKVGTTAMVLAMIDDDAIAADLSFATPVRSLREVSYDPSLQHTHAMADGRRMRALDVQWQFLEAAGKYAETHGHEVVGGDEVGKDILARWEAVLTALEHDPESLADQLDWVAKKRLFEGYMDRHGAAWGDPAIRALDLQYHDLRPDKCLARRLRLQRVTEDGPVERARKEPPARTRAYFRGRCLERFAPNIVAANWDSLVFDIGTDPLRRVPMMEPLRGTADHVATLLDEAVDAADLLRRLGSRWTPSGRDVSAPRVRGSGRPRRYGVGNSPTGSGSAGQSLTGSGRWQNANRSVGRHLETRPRPRRKHPRHPSAGPSSRARWTSCSTRSTTCSRPTPRSS